MNRLFTLIAFLTISNFLFSQNCTPDPTLTTPGLKPSKLANGIVGEAYNQVATLMVPLDTVIKYNGSFYSVKVDSAVVVGISNMPKGFTYICNTSNCTWGGGKRGCAKLMGNPVAADTGFYAIYVKVRTFFKIVGLPSQLDQLDSSIIDFNVVMPNAINELSQSLGFKVYPNPTKEILTILPNRYSKLTSYQVLNLMGQNMNLVPSYFGNSGEIMFNISSLDAGLFMVIAESEGKTYQSRFIKN